jgi:Uma2 family endonuclease
MNPLTHFDPDDPYPDSDGQPMAENTEQYAWLVKIKENLEILFADRPDVFVAGNLFWYPHPDRQVSHPLAPDVMVAFGRPKGRRGSYRQWEEGGIAPQVIFEIVSPGNSAVEMREKLAFYDRFGAEEYYVYDPDHNRLDIWTRQAGRLGPQAHVGGWTSPRLGVRFIPGPDALELYYPNGERFLTSVELDLRARQAEAEAAEARQQAEQAQQQAERAQQQAEQERQRAARLAERLRALGIDPDAA